MTSAPIKPKQYFVGLVLISFGAILLGASAIFVRLSSVSPTSTAFFRALLAIPFLLIWFKFTKSSASINPSILKSLALCGLFFALDMGVWNWSIFFTSVAHSALLANMAPIFVTLIGVFYFKDKVSKAFLKCLLTAIIGVFIVIKSGSGGSDARLFGDFLGILTALFYAGYIIYVKKLTGIISPIEVLLFSTIFTSLFLFPIAILEPGKFIPSNSEEWSLLLCYALVSQTIAQGLITIGIAKLSAHFSSLVLLIQPVATALFGWFLLEESLYISQILGGMLVLLAIYLASKVENSNPN